MEKPLFTAHNILLDDGTYTKDKNLPAMTHEPRLISAKKVFDSVLQGDRDRLRIADLGCLEGGYATEFARLGYDSLGIEVRDSNFAACNYVKSKTNLSNLHFAQDDVLNVERYGRFDGVFCCGLLYHLDKPREYLKVLGGITRKVLILQTHFALTDDFNQLGLSDTRFQLSPLEENEGIQGRWYEEFNEDTKVSDKDNMRWSSWENHRSFWPTKEYLLQSMYDAGFDLVMEEFDSLRPNIVQGLGREYYSTLRGTFIGIKSAA
jgi:SAM-dependent methyltransferase